MLGLPANVVTLAWVSFFNDLASEMVTPLIPLMLVGMSSGGGLALGLIEGTAEAVSAGFKLLSGYYSDLWGGRRKPWVLVGYLLSNLARPLLGSAGSVFAVGTLRATDRIGKGLRTAPRDAMLVDSTAEEIRGRAFGFQRALDNGGAVGGSLAAAAVLTWTSLKLPQAINLSMIPGLCGVLLVAFVLKERHRELRPAATVGAAEPMAAKPLVIAPMPPLPASLKRYLLLVGVFSFARASETFIVLRGHELGMDTVSLLLLWAMLSCAKSVAAWLGGDRSDRLGRRLLVRVGWLAYALGFGLMALVHTTLALWGAALVFGAMAGTAEGAERALVGELARIPGPGTQVGSGRAYGWYNFVVGGAAIPAGLVFGALWQFQGAVAAFSAAAVIAGVCVTGLSGAWFWR